MQVSDLEPIAVLQDVPDEDPPSPKMPTAFPCGSRAKVELMRERVEAGESIFHPFDCVSIVVWKD